MERRQTAVRLKRIEIFLGEYRTFRASEQQHRLDGLGRFISTYRSHQQLWRQSHPAQFNALCLFKTTINEGGHSAFLGWLLNAQETHGQGNLFLRAFLQACRPVSVLTIPDTYTVKLEYAGPCSVVDVCVYRVGMFVLYIENKTTAPDTEGQTAREFQDMRHIGARLGVPAEAQLAVYLTPDGRTAPDRTRGHGWLTAAYRDVATAFENALPVVTDDKVKYVILDWLDMVTAFRAIRR